MRIFPPGSAVEPWQERRVQGAFRVSGDRQGAIPLSSIAIKGVQGTSLLDFPGRVATLVFTGGCNLSCPFCHNPGLVLCPEDFPDVAIDELLADLEKRKRFIDGVVISGGEPTLDTGLPAFLRQLKALGLQVKLDSNGLLPQVIEGLLDEQLLDYLAIDLKTIPQRYSELHSQPVASAGLLRTIELAKAASIEVEFRTTCVPQLIDRQAIAELGGLLRGAQLWVLQQFVPGQALAADWQVMPAYAPRRVEEFAELAEEYVDRVAVRGL
jgi:pyruvate formate lyase activating enzyme